MIETNPTNLELINYEIIIESNFIKRMLLVASYISL